MNDLQLRKIVFGLSHISGAYTVLDCLIWVHLGALEIHDVLLSCGWFLCLKTTIQRTSSRLIRCVKIACAPMRFPFSHLYLLDATCTMTGWVCQWKPFWIPVGDTFKKAYVEDLSSKFQILLILSFPKMRETLFLELLSVTLPVPSSHRQAPKPEVYASTQEHNVAPLPPLPCRPTCERLELPFSDDDILSGFKDHRLPRSDLFTTWGTMTPEEILAEHMVDVRRIAADFRDAFERIRT